MLVAGILLALAAPAAAGAQAVPPGNSGVDQYQESIPGAGGNRPTGPSAGAGNASGSGELVGGRRNSSERGQEVSDSSQHRQAARQARARRKGHRRDRGGDGPRSNQGLFWEFLFQQRHRTGHGMGLAGHSCTHVGRRGERRRAPLASGRAARRCVRRCLSLMFRGRRARALWLAGVLLLLCVMPQAAVAKHGLLTGTSDGLYISPDAGERSTWLDRTVDSRAGIVRINLLWASVAGSPAFGSDESRPVARMTSA